MSARGGTQWDRFVDKARGAWRDRGVPPLSMRRSARHIPATIDAGAPVLVVSPHLDDAVLSAFAFLHDRRATVLSVFTGSPEGDEPSHWDRALGHEHGGEIMRKRLAEDDRALESLNIETTRLDLLENGYRTGPIPDGDVRTMREAVRSWLSSTSGEGVVVAPAGAGAVDNRLYRVRWNATVPLLRVPGGGLPHPDHLIVRDAVVDEALDASGRVVLYEELPYRWTGRGQRPVARLAAARKCRVTRFDLDVVAARKATAVETYKSQIPGLFRPWVPDVPSVMPSYERYWLLEKS